ncbi:MAG: hypothetical protein EXS16_04570 [Gemmataceae bacterium]|nr:hypothetical protein [Gemmataceae bacterium]
MRTRYLVVDEGEQLRLISRREMESIWRGEIFAADIGCWNRTELRIVSAICDRRLVPVQIYLMRMPLSGGCFTRSNRRALRSFMMPNRVTVEEMFDHHSDGWPRDFFPQLAVALDVPCRMLNVPFGIGGPLMLAAALSISPKRAARLLQ